MGSKFKFLFSWKYVKWNVSLPRPFGPRSLRSKNELLVHFCVKIQSFLILWIFFFHFLAWKFKFFLLFKIDRKVFTSSYREFLAEFWRENSKFCVFREGELKVQFWVLRNMEFQSAILAWKFKLFSGINYFEFCFWELQKKFYLLNTL